MKKASMLLPFFMLFLLSSCANLFSPPYDPRLEGTWEGSATIVTENNGTDVLGNNYNVVTTEYTREKYTFYNGNEVKRESSWSKDVSSNSASTSFSGGNGTYIYEWKNLRDNYDINLNEIDSDIITIKGIKLTRSK